MKTSIQFLFILFFITLCCYSQSNAQNKDYSFTSLGNAFLHEENESAIPKDVNILVTQDFNKRFNGAMGVIWSLADDHTSVYFKQKGVETRAIYNKNNKLECTIKFFQGKDVPSYVAAMMGRNGYNNMTITDVTEIKGRYTTNLFVVMKDDKSHVTVQVHPDGVVSVYNESEIEAK